MPENNQDTGFTSMSLSKDDLAFYTEIRNLFCEKNGIDRKKISVQTVLRTGMTVYKQRLELGMLKDGENGKAE